jgi:hypothetical protein
MKMPTVRILKDLTIVVVMMDTAEMVSTALETSQLTSTVRLVTVRKTVLVTMDTVDMEIIAQTSTNVQKT